MEREKIKISKTKPKELELPQYTYIYFSEEDEFYLANKGLVEDIIYH